MSSAVKTKRGGLWLVLAFGLVEILLRIAGWGPPDKAHVPVYMNDPIDAQPFTPDSLFGYLPVPGQYNFIDSDRNTFVATHDELGRRITQPLDEFLEKEPEDEVWLFGGAVGYGWGLNNGETAAWLVQSWLPAYNVVNYSVPGCTIECISERLEREEAFGSVPTFVVLVISSDVWSAAPGREYFQTDEKRKRPLRSAIVYQVMAPARWIKNSRRRNNINDEIDRIVRVAGQEAVRTLVLSAREMEFRTDTGGSTAGRSRDNSDRQNWIAEQILEALGVVQ